MLKRHRKSILIIILLTILGFAFFLFYKNNALEQLYTQHEFNEDVGKIYTGLGESAQDRGDYEKALLFYKQALHYRHHDLNIYDQIGICFESCHKPDEALRIYFQALCINPNFTDLRMLDDEQLPDRLVPYSQLPDAASRWQGQPLKDKSIFIYTEKSLEETIQYCRFLPKLAQQGAQVYVKPQKALYQLFKNNLTPVTVLNESQDINDLSIDYYTSLFDIMHYLNIGLSDIDNKPYLSGSEKNKRSKINGINKQLLNIGIYWHNNHNQEHYVPLTYFYDMAQMPGIQLYSLQDGPNKEQLKNLPVHKIIIDINNATHDLVEAIPVMQELDLIISIDSEIAHLSGALGIATILLSKHNQDWRWLSHTKDFSFSWYQNFTVISQNQACSWKPVFDKIAEIIKEKIR